MNRAPFDFEQPPPALLPQPRRYPQYAFYRDPELGTCEVVTTEPGGSQRATWTTWAPAKPPEPERQPTHTLFEHPGRPEATVEFQDLIKLLREKNDPTPHLMRGEIKPM